MLDDPDMRESWHKRFYEFVLTEWETFREFNRAFYREGKEGICNLLARIGDAEFPDTRKWIHLCCVPAVIDNPKAAKGVLTLGKTIEDPFAKEVAEQLIRRFYSER